jgi:hypothetical protein
MASNNRGTSGSKRSDKNIEYGNMDGSIEFGHLNLGDSDGLGADVKSGVKIQAFDSRHYTLMENDGVRKGWTLNRSPGPYAIKAASDSAGTEDVEEGVGILILAETGDIVLRAPNGRIRMSAQDIHIRADGPDNTRGTVIIDSNEAVNINTTRFKVEAKSGIRLETPYSMELVASTAMSFYSNFLNGLSSASSFLADKNYSGSTKEFFKNTKFNLE